MDLVESSTKHGIAGGIYPEITLFNISRGAKVVKGLIAVASSGGTLHKNKIENSFQGGWPPKVLEYSLFLYCMKLMITTYKYPVQGSCRITELVENTSTDFHKGMGAQKRGSQMEGSAKKR